MGAGLPGDSFLKLLVRVGSTLCAVPVRQVVEVMRPLPVEPAAGAPAFVLGVAVIRGAPVPVVDAATLLGITEAPEAARFVTLRVGERRVALAVTGVLHVHEIDPARLSDLPPLLKNARAGIVQALGALDRELLVLLEAVPILSGQLARELVAQRVRS